jgi:Cu+-exporting ATPase
MGRYQTGFTALITVWIVACPCALLLSSTFTFGNLLHILAENGMYIKNASVLEKMKKVNTLVFDKTGTLTHSNQSKVEYIGRELSAREWKEIYSVSYHSIHPLSKAIRQFVNETESFHVSEFTSYDGKGISGRVDGQLIRLGSQEWLQVRTGQADNITKVFAELKGEVVGFFEIKNEYRKGIFNALQQLKKHFKLHLLSGDNNAEEKHLKPIFDEVNGLKFNQLPEQKTQHIAHLQQNGQVVLMIGDGLNDAQAFEKSDIGMAIIENENNFLPACDVILKVDQLPKLKPLLNYIQNAKTILLSCFAISVIYNLIGLSYAMQGLLTPVVAAILMPISTVSIVGISFLLSRIFARTNNLNI